MTGARSAQSGLMLSICLSDSEDRPGAPRGDTGVRRRRCDWTEIKWLTMLNSSSHIAFRPRHPHDARARPLIPER